MTASGGRMAAEKRPAAPVGISGPGRLAAADAGASDPGLTTQRSYAAVLLTWSPHSSGSAGDEAARLSSQLTELCQAGVHVGVFTAASADDADRALGLRPAGPGTCHLVTGGGARIEACDAAGRHTVWRRSIPPGQAPASATGPAEAVAHLASVLHHRGIGPGLVLVIGGDLAALVDNGEDGDGVPAVTALRRAATAVPGCSGAANRPHAAAATVEDLLAAQLARHAARRVPHVDEDPAWTLGLGPPADAGEAGTQEALLTLADGRFGTRGRRETDPPASSPSVVAAGVYTANATGPTLLAAPEWTAVDMPGPATGRRILDLRTGVLLHDADGLRTLRFASCVHPGTMALRAEAPTGALPGDAALRPCDEVVTDTCVSAVRSTRGGGVVTAARQVVTRGSDVDTLERLAAYVADPVSPPPPDAASTALDRASAMGFTALLDTQRAAWADRWKHAAVSIHGDPQLQLAVRFALFHLLSTVADEGEAGVGARGLSGLAYAGHVFWDADVFVLPVVAAVRPQAARAMLQYRLGRLDAARRRALERGWAGALWPWESADDGTDVTPPTVQDANGHLVPIRTGEQEHHIVADVAWAADHYAAWADPAFVSGAGLPLLTDGARFWASRAERDPDGRYHIRGVIGPDEYHEAVDDNAFTNVMARWHLRRAAMLAERTGAAPRAEVASWRTVAAGLVDGYDPATGIYEQCAGFHDLTPIIIEEIARPPVAADILLGRDVVQRSQVVKQADVLMLHHLVPDDVAAGSLSANLAHYDPRTAHGSSLSPAIHAAAWARARQPDRARDLLQLAARLDLDDLTGTTAAGLHMATFGGVWQALAFGFLGLRASGEALRVDPVLPAAWSGLDLALCFRGANLTVRATHTDVRVDTDRPLPVRVGAADSRTVQPPGLTMALPARRRSP